MVWLYVMILLLPVVQLLVKLEGEDETDIKYLLTQQVKVLLTQQLNGAARPSNVAHCNQSK